MRPLVNSTQPLQQRSGPWRSIRKNLESMETIDKLVIKSNDQLILLDIIIIPQLSLLSRESYSGYQYGLKYPF